MIFDLQFFGGGGSSTEQVKKRDPMNPLYEQEQTNMFNDLKPYWDQVVNDREGFNRAYSMGQDSLAKVPGLLDRIPGLIDEQFSRQSNIYGQQDAIGKQQDAVLAQQGDVYGRQSGLLDRLDDIYGQQSSALENWNRMLATGEIAPELYSNMMGGIQKGLNESVGSTLNSLGNRGVLNSSVTTQGLNNLTRNAADSMQRGYSDLWNSSMSNLGNIYNSLGQTYGNVNSTYNSLGQTYNNLGQTYNNLNNRFGNLTGMYSAIGNNYNNAANTINTSANTLLDIPRKAMDAFMAPAMPFYNLNQDYLRNYYGHEDYDTVVRQGK